LKPWGGYLDTGEHLFDADADADGGDVPSFSARFPPFLLGKIGGNLQLARFLSRSIKLGRICTCHSAMAHRDLDGKPDEKSVETDSILTEAPQAK